MIFSEILFELKRIANALEAIADAKLEKVPKEFAPPVEFFDSRLSNEDDEEKLQERRFNNMVEQELEAANKKGFFFEEDAISEDLLERL